MKYIIYLVTNKINEKYYVGYTSREFSTRWNEHCYPSAAEESRHFSRAIQKYKRENFSHQILGIVEGECEAITLERLWIRFLRSYDPQIGYNLTLGGDGLGSPSEQTRKKMSDSHKGKKPSKVTVERRSAAVRETWRKKRSSGIPLCSPEEAVRLKALSKFAAEVRWSKRKALLPPVSEEHKNSMIAKL